MNILVVDDEKEIADLVELYLKNENYTVYKFYTSEEAIECINTVKLDFAILDVMIKGKNGFEICKMIRDKNLKFPIIMLTAKIEDNDKITGLTLGADDYITKPFNPLELIARVKSQIRRYTKYNGKAYIMSIDTDTYDVGKEYYILRNQFEQDQRWEVWIDKETGLVIREIQRDGEKRFITGTDIVKEVRDCTTIYKYELNIVKDEDVKVPEDSTYKIEYINEEINAK